MNYLYLLTLIPLLIIVLDIIHYTIFNILYVKTSEEYHYLDGSVSNYEFGVNRGKPLHRIGKPARYIRQTEEYYENGLRHRLNGPAIIIHNNLLTSSKFYYVYGHHLGNNLPKKEFERLKNIKLKELVFS